MFSQGSPACCLPSSFVPLLLDLGVGVQGSSGDLLVALFLGTVVGVGTSLDLLAQLLQDPFDLGCFLEVFLVGPLQDLDIFGLERLSREDVGEVERVDDLADFLFLVVLPLGLFVLELHLRVLGLLLVVHRLPADVMGQLLLEVHLLREYRNILHLVRRLGLLELR